MFVVPFAGAAIGLSTWVEHLQAQRQTAYRTTELVRLISSYDELLYQVARERGQTAGFIARERKGAGNLNAARRSLDEAVGAVESIQATQFDSLSLSLIHESQLQVRDVLSPLAEIRQQVDNVGAPRKAFDYYSSVNRSLQETVRYLSAGLDSEIRQLFETKLLLSQRNEVFGKIRDLLNGIFSAG